MNSITSETFKHTRDVAREDGGSVFDQHLADSLFTIVYGWGRGGGRERGVPITKGSKIIKLLSELMYKNLKQKINNYKIACQPLKIKEAVFT